jgi:hypothetical protein
VSGLWTNDRDTLAEGLMRADGVDVEPGDVLDDCRAVADALVDDGVVQVLDPDDTELVEEAAERLHRAVYGGIPWGMASYFIKDRRRQTVRTVIVTLRQP